MVNSQEYCKKDFESDQEVRWCPGCGDYTILAAIQKVCANLDKKREDMVFISGIGCSSRFPYYMNTYGMHTIHGRAPAFASGVKLQNPNLSVWVTTGDGDALSIGGNHFIHAIRKNIDINIIIFNNEIYGLTKGQYSPTSVQGLVTNSSPYGVIDHPFSPASLSIGSGATFFARTVDNDMAHMNDIFLQAAQHNGISVVEVLQNCVIFNDKTHDSITNKNIREENTLRLKHGQPMIFGKGQDKGIILEGPDAKVVSIIKSGITADQLLKHNTKSPFLANLLTSFNLPDLPIPLGIFRNVEKETYDQSLYKQIEDISIKKGKMDMQTLFHSGDTWEIYSNDSE